MNHKKASTLYSCITRGNVSRTRLLKVEMGEISSFVAHGAPVYNCIYV